MRTTLVLIALAASTLAYAQDEDNDNEEEEIEVVVHECESETEGKIIKTKYAALVGIPGNKTLSEVRTIIATSVSTSSSACQKAKNDAWDEYDKKAGYTCAEPCTGSWWDNPGFRIYGEPTRATTGGPGYDAKVYCEYSIPWKFTCTKPS